MWTLWTEWTTGLDSPGVLERRVERSARRRFATRRGTQPFQGWNPSSHRQPGVRWREPRATGRNTFGVVGSAGGRAARM